MAVVVPLVTAGLSGSPQPLRLTYITEQAQTMVAPRTAANAISERFIIPLSPANSYEKVNRIIYSAQGTFNLTEELPLFSGNLEQAVPVAVCVELFDAVLHESRLGITLRIELNELHP